MGMFLVKFNINFKLSINNHENFKYDSFKTYRTPTFKRQLWRESHGRDGLEQTFLLQSTCFFKRLLFRKILLCKVSHRTEKEKGLASLNSLKNVSLICLFFKKM